MPRLAIFDIVVAGYRFVWEERRDFGSLAFPAIAVLSLASAVLVWLFMPRGIPGEEAPQGADIAAVGVVGVILALLSLAFWVMFSVAWHRKYLMPNEATTVAAALRWRMRQTRFLLLAISLALSLWVLVFAGSSLPILLGIAVSGSSGTVLLLLLVFFGVLIASLFIYARLSLLFPAAAVDHRLNFGQCWELTRGHGWRLLGIILLAAIPVAIGGVIAGSVLNAVIVAAALEGSLSAAFIGTLINQSIGFVGLAAGVSVLSIAYRELIGTSRAAPLART